MYSNNAKWCQIYIVIGSKSSISTIVTFTLKDSFAYELRDMFIKLKSRINMTNIFGEIS